MRTEPRQILQLLDSGQITLSEAEEMVDSASRPALPGFELGRIRQWISLRLGYVLSLTLLVGILLEPPVLAAAQATCHALTGSQTLQLYLHRLLEAML